VPGGLIAAFDIGTTAAKGTLIDRDRGIVHEGTQAYGMAHRAGGLVEQEPGDWWGAVEGLTRAFWRAGWEPHSVEAVALTGQMQDVVVVDREGLAVGPAILYSDARAVDQAVAIRARLREHGASDDDLTFVDGTDPIAKLVWTRERAPGRLTGCAGVLFGAKDYVLVRLTGVRATDATTAATTCLFSPRTRAWRAEWVQALDLPSRWLPTIVAADAVAGVVSRDGAQATGLPVGVPVYGGMGDAAAATLSAGLTAPGAAYLYLGTTGWAASVARAVGPGGAGVRHLPYVVGDDVIRIAPVLNAGGAYQWIVQLLAGEEHAGVEGAAVDYARFEHLLENTPGQSGGAVFLPYLYGERCPVQEPRAMGAFVHLGAATSRGALGWAALEGICFSLRQVLETLGSSTPTVRVLGGMARGALVRQLLADVCGVRIRVAPAPSAAGALAAAVPVAVARGWFADIPAAVEAWFDKEATDVTEPSPSRMAHYAALYETYRQVYPQVAQIG